jgi:Protein of unknown function (DUF1598)
MSRRFQWGMFLLLAMFMPRWTMAQQQAGVEVKADGVLRIKQYQSLTGALAVAWQKEAQAKLPPDLARVSDKRKISLNRLEAAIAAKLKNGESISREMQFLAGLTRVENVFFFPGSGDIVIAGPAEGWAADPSGRVVGIFSGRATVELQDLITALRAYPPGKDTRAEMIGCSIDPTKDGLVKMQEFFNSAARNFSPSQTQQLVAGMKENLGLQNVTIRGISPKTHFAQVLVEADYRMKLIGIGLETPPAKISSYVSKAKGAANNALQRWYFQPNYECVRVTEDNLAMELVGEGVKLSGESEVVGADGARAGGGAKDPASDAFVTSFTQEYPKLAAKVAVYAQLRNLIDLAVAAAFIQEQDLYGKANWTANVLMDEKQVSVESYESPVNVESAVNAVWKGNRLYTPIGGGVSIRPYVALQPEHLLKDDNGALKASREQVKVEGLAEGQWWWD